MLSISEYRYAPKADLIVTPRVESKEEKTGMGA